MLGDKVKQLSESSVMTIHCTTAAHALSRPKESGSQSPSFNILKAMIKLYPDSILEIAKATMIEIGKIDRSPETRPRESHSSQGPNKLGLEQ